MGFKIPFRTNHGQNPSLYSQRGPYKSTNTLSAPAYCTSCSPGCCLRVCSRRCHSNSFPLGENCCLRLSVMMLKSIDSAKPSCNTTWKAASSSNGSSSAAHWSSGDLDLRLKRFELYVRQTGIPEDQWAAELLPLLDDASF